MKKIDWNKIKISALSTIKAFPVELLISICMFIAVLIEKERLYTNEQAVNNSLALIPLFWIVSFSFNHLFTSPRLRWIYYSSLLFLPAAPFINVFPLEIPYAMAWIIAIAAIFGCRQQKDNLFFTIDTLRNPYHVVISGILTLALSGLLSGIYASLIYIFDFNSTHIDHVIFYLFFFPFTVIFPFLFCLFQKMEHNNYEWKADRFFEILNNWILSPALLAYTTLLYVYGCKILITWNLPKGMLSYMISIFLFLAVIARACQKLLRKEFYNWYYKYFNLIAIPILILFWVGIIYRIQEYGFTEERVYLCLLGILISVISVLSFNGPNIKYLYYIYFVMILLAPVTFIPAINAKNLGLMSQERRLRQVIKELDLKDAETGLIRDKNIPEMLRDSSSQFLYNKLVETFNYVKDQSSSKYMQKTYGYSSVESLNTSLFSGNLPDYIKYSDTNRKEKYFVRNGLCIVSTKEYNELIDFNFSSTTQNDSIFLKIDNDVLVTAFDISNFISDRPTLLLDETSDHEIDSLLYLKNDSCFALINYLYISNKKIKNMSVNVLLKK